MKRPVWKTRTRMKVFIIASLFAAYLTWFVVTQYPKLNYQADIAAIIKAIGFVWLGSFGSVVLGIAAEKIWGNPENINPVIRKEDNRDQ
jgi:hypothetical protein